MCRFSLFLAGVALVVVASSVTPAAADSSSSHLDRLLNRLDADHQPTTPPPQQHRVRHNRYRQLSEEEAAGPPISPPPPPLPRHPPPQSPPLEYDESEEDAEEDEDDLQADNLPRSPYTTSLGRPDWKGIARKNSGKYFGLYYTPAPTNALKSNEDESGGNSKTDPKAEVRSHLTKMYHEFSCRTPMPKIIRVSDHYPDRAGSYHPSCTKLHVCAEDTGCCGPSQKCGPKATHKVELYFYVTVEVPSLGHGSKTMRIEKLIFYNHTECSCQDRGDEMPRDVSPLDSNKIPDQPLNYKCKCPSEYTVRNLANGSCSCDCFDKQRDCTKYKRGRENFNQHDRMCIEMGKCTQPSCDFGVYNRRLGRCPRKHEKFRSWARYKL